MRIDQEINQNNNLVNLNDVELNDFFKILILLSCHFSCDKLTAANSYIERIAYQIDDNCLV